MAQISRVALKAFFETGDNPTEANFIDLIDSLFNFVDDTTTSLDTDTYVFMKDGNSAENDDGNWRIRLDTGSGNLITEKRKSGAWVTSETSVF